MTAYTDTFDARKDAPKPGANHRFLLREARVLASGAGAGSDGRYSRDYEMLSLWIDGEFRLAITTPVFVFVAAATSLIWMPLKDAAAWLALIFIGKGIVFALCRVFKSIEPEKVNVRKWEGVFAASEFFYLITWSYGLFKFWNEAAQSERIFLVAIMLILLSLRSPHNAAILPVARASAATVTLVIVTRCFLTDGSFYMAVAGIAFFLGFYFLKRAESQHEAAVENFAFRAEKDTLIAELERERKNSDGARRRAEDANIAKSRFLANISHELRTPLNAIIGFSEVMKEELMGAHAVPVYKDYSGDIYNSGQHLLKLINEILDLSRIEAGRYELREKAVAVDLIGADCLKLIKLRAEERGVALSTEFEQGLPAIYADDRAIRQIWLNLISNAIKFTPRDGQVILTVRRSEDGGVVCSVRDNGPGIPDHEIPLVLSSFGQGSLAHEKAEEGAGLGLPIVQGLMQLHDGTFKLKSELRVGTEAIFAFPSDRVLQSGQTQIEPAKNKRERSPAGAYMR